MIRLDRARDCKSETVTYNLPLDRPGRCLGTVLI